MAGLQSSLVGSSCLAQHMNAKDGPCQAPSEETGCFASALKKSDSQLNQTYLQVQGVVDGDELVKLEAAQRLWIQFRDANCEAEHELYAGGSAASMGQTGLLGSGHEASHRGTQSDVRLEAGKTGKVA